MSSEAITFTNSVQTAPAGKETYHHGVDPSTRKQLWPVPIATSEDLNEAVRAAKKAFVSWGTSTWESRQQYLTKLSEILTERRNDMASILSKECGKPEQFAQLEVQDAIAMLAFYGKTPPLPEHVIQDDQTLRLTLSYGPIGIVGAISPWNFPLVLSMSKIAAGLLAGNTVIVKPSPFTPYSILKFVEWAQSILPPSVLQAVNGDDKLGPLLVAHPDVPKISFTGSTATGRKIGESGGRLLKRMSLELGGNDACIVCKDVDIAIVAPQVALGAFFNSGQICIASKRIYVHKDIYEPFLKAMTEVVKSWKVGPVSENPMLGPVQNEMQYNIVKGYFADCKKNGYKFALGGEEIEPGSSFAIQPAIIDNPPDNSLIVTSEPFGPIVPLLSWSTEEEVLSRANESLSGLGGSVWSGNLETAKRLSQNFESGMVWINSFPKPLAQGYFSGIKESGIGGEQGAHSLLAYSHAKTIHQYKARVGKL